MGYTYDAHGDKRNVHTVFVAKLEEKRPVGKPRRVRIILKLFLDK
jgi:hypothetical protein